MQATTCVHGRVLHSFRSPGAPLRSSIAPPHAGASGQLVPAAVQRPGRSLQRCHATGSAAGGQEDKPDKIEVLATMCETVYNLDEAQTVIGFAVGFLRETPSTLPLGSAANSL